MIRLTALYLVAVMILGVWATFVTGQELPTPIAAATPDRTFVDVRLAGRTTMTITVTDDAIVAPAHVPAGPTLVTQVNATSSHRHLTIMQVPDGVSDDALAAVTTSSVTPDWLATARMVGNPNRAAPSGGVAIALVDLTPGRYLVVDPTDRREPVAFVAEGDTTAAGSNLRMPEIAVDVSVDMLEMTFAMPAELAAGPLVWQVSNAGSTTHDLAVIPVPEGATIEQLLLAFEPAWVGAPLSLDLWAVWSDWSPRPVAGVGALSPTGRTYAQIDLAPGHYVAVCLAPDGSLVPHVMHGMAHLFTVTEAPA